MLARRHFRACWGKLARYSILAALIGLLAGCAATPIIDQNWISSNCRALAYFVPEQCSLYSNCVRASAGRCSCTYYNGVYTGSLKNGTFHGRGIYKWTNGQAYDGYWKDGQKYCGMESNGQTFIQYRYGRASRQGKHQQTNGNSALAAAAFLLAVEAANPGSAARTLETYGLMQEGATDQALREAELEKLRLRNRAIQNGYPIIDFDYDWDYLAGSRQWVCRGVQTGQFAESSNCTGKLLIDDRWPN